MRPRDFVDFWLGALELILQFLRDRGIRTYERLEGDYRARKLLDEVLWKLTEIDGKYTARYVSAGFLDACNRLGRPPNSAGKWRGEPDDGCCQHEHVFERKLLIEELLTLDPTQAREFVLPRTIGCVVLKREHAKLRGAPPATLEDPWARYRGRVDVFDRKEKRWIVRAQPEPEIEDVTR